MPEEQQNEERALDFYDHIAQQVGIKTIAGRNALKVAIDNVLLLDKKQQDYGPRNIIVHGKTGVVVRMTDKMERIITLCQKKGRRSRAKNEPIRDSFRDISNYAVIWLLLDSNQWPDKEALIID